MNGYMSFPVAVQAVHDSYGSNRGPEIDLLNELTQGIVGFAAELKRRAEERKQQEQARAKLVATASRALNESERMVMARDTSTNPARLAELANDGSSLVRLEVLYNPALPATALTNLMYDEDRFVAAQARAMVQAGRVAA